MGDKFQQLVGTSPQKKVTEAETFFLDKTKEAIDANHKATALDIAAI
jgi:hypothetical protein